jgi:hypothetical protein
MKKPDPAGTRRSGMLKSESIYIAMDADDVGSQIELAILSGDVEKAKKVHDAVQCAITMMRADVASDSDLSLVFSGCDDVILRVKKEIYNITIAEKLRAAFRQTSGCTMSAGVGCTIESAFTNLRKAKLGGKNRVLEGI